MSNAGYIRSGLVRRGLPEHVADAFMVNFRDESGLNPGINEAKPLVPGSRGGFGLYQLTGPRRRQYEAFAAQRGVVPADVDAQLDFLMGELSGTEKRAGDRILAAPDTATAAQAIVNDFLRPAASHRNERSSRYASLGGGAVAFGPEPSPSGASSAIQSAMTQGSPPSPTTPTAGASMSGPAVNVSMPSKQRSKLQEALLARAMGGGENIRHPLELAGNLAQVYAANRGMKNAESEEATGLQRILAGADLDPAFAAVAQLGGDRESLQSAILAQQESRTAAANTAYEREQDSAANARAERTLAIQERAASAPEKPPASVQEYEFARTQGYTGSFADWEQANRRAGATTINTGDATGTGAFYKTADEGRAKSFLDLANGGTEAQRRMLQVDQLEGLLANVPTGGTAALKQAAGEWGINTEGLDDIQSAAALINQMVPAQRPPGSGTMSDADLALFKASLPRIINQPGGNELIVRTMRGIANYDMAIGQIANSVLNREIDPAEGQRRMASLENPLARYRDTAGSIEPAQPEATDAAVSRPTTDAEYQALPSGALFIDPDDGQTYRKP